MAEAKLLCEFETMDNYLTGEAQMVLNALAAQTTEPPLSERVTLADGEVDDYAVGDPNPDEDFEEAFRQFQAGLGKVAFVDIDEQTGELATQFRVRN
jgi:hypothetical protein